MIYVLVNLVLKKTFFFDHVVTVNRYVELAAMASPGFAALPRSRLKADDDDDDAIHSATSNSLGLVASECQVGVIDSLSSTFEKKSELDGDFSIGININSNSGSNAENKSKLSREFLASRLFRRSAKSRRGRVADFRFRRHEAPLPREAAASGKALLVQRVPLAAHARRRL